jgi:hypothetical protein
MLLRRSGNAVRNQPQLLLPLAEADAALREQISVGERLFELEIVSSRDLDLAGARYEEWDAQNLAILRQMFVEDSVAAEYNHAPRVRMRGDRSLVHEASEYFIQVREHLRRLEAIRDMLVTLPGGETAPDLEEPAEVIPFPAPVSALPAAGVPARASAGPPTVAAIHVPGGVTARESVAVVSGAVDVEPVRTLLESLGVEVTGAGAEDPDLAFGIVVLTGDDLGAVAESEEFQLRPGQREIFMLGVLVGRLGPERVCVLIEDGVAMPPGTDGIASIVIDAHEGWQLRLARALRNAGLQIDMNRVV